MPVPTRHACDLPLSVQRSQIELDMVKGDDLEAFRRLLHLVMLQDPLPLQPAVLHQGLLLPLEELIVDPSRMSERDMMLSSLPNLCRVLNCGAAVITGGSCLASVTPGTCPATIGNHEGASV